MRGVGGEGGGVLGSVLSTFGEKVRNVKPGRRLREQVEGLCVFENIAEFPFF